MPKDDTIKDKIPDEALRMFAIALVSLLNFGSTNEPKALFVEADDIVNYVREGQ